MNYLIIWFSHTFGIQSKALDWISRRLNARGSQVHFDDFSGEAFFCFTIRCALEIT